MSAAAMLRLCHIILQNLRSRHSYRYDRQTCALWSKNENQKKIQEKHNADAHQLCCGELRENRHPTRVSYLHTTRLFVIDEPLLNEQLQLNSDNRTTWIKIVARNPRPQWCYHHHTNYYKFSSTLYLHNKNYKKNPNN